MTEEFNYEGADLDSMDGADNYHRWILSYFEPFLGPRVVEVGAGIGSFSRLVAELDPVQQMLMIEPAVEMVPLLERNAQAIEGVATETFAGMLADAGAEVAAFAPQSFVYVNVFEHVEHDEEEIAQVFEMLPSGGTLCIFVPALPFLYSKFDASIDHFRRYTLKGLRRSVREAGFEIETDRYFDVAGILPWLIKFKLLRSTKLDTASVGVYDRFVVPIMRRVERILRPPLGKNVLLVARKP